MKLNDLQTEIYVIIFHCLYSYVWILNVHLILLRRIVLGLLRSHYIVQSAISFAQPADKSDAKLSIVPLVGLVSSHIYKYRLCKMHYEIIQMSEIYTETSDAVNPRN